MLQRRVLALLLAMLVAFSLFACAPAQAEPPYESPSSAVPEEQRLPVERDGYYYDPEHVVLYLYYYGELPSNFITKSEARELGWSGGSVEPYRADGAIGGDRFNNREKHLPSAEGRTYTECDMYTYGMNERGARRLVFSNDGLYFYTEDHYNTFRELCVTEKGEVEWK